MNNVKHFPSSNGTVASYLYMKLHVLKVRICIKAKVVTPFFC